jgi:hypothetical protein
MSLILDGTAGVTFPNSTVQASAGSVLQVVSATKTDTFSTTSTSFVDITGLSVAITPKFSTSKILVLLNIGASGQSTTNSVLFNIVRNGTAIAQPTVGANPSTVGNYYGGGVTAFSNSMNFLDSPATSSSITYKIQGRVDAGTMYINQVAGAGNYTSISTITVLEIAA